MAVIFLAHMENGEMKNSGLCLQCARELNIPQVQEVMDKMGLSDEEIEAMSNQMAELMGSDSDHEAIDGDNLDGDFEEASPKTMPFFEKFFSDSAAASADQPDEAPREVGFTREQPERERDNRGDRKKESRRKRKFLDNFCENLTEKAKKGDIDRIVGRDNEIYRVMQILNRRTKNNPVLIGEPGVGKTAIAEGIAVRLASGKVPHRLADKELYLLDLTALVAGTQFRGQFESRVKGLLGDIKEAGNVILFIDEVHNIVGAGDSEGSMNTANILKPALSRGELQVIGATTFSEYRKYIEKDAALERRFQPVKVEEPSISDTTEVLKGIKGYYEDFHRVRVPDSVVQSCVVLSERYITDRFLPDKAIDLLDEACSCSVLNNKSMSEFDALNDELKELLEKEERYEDEFSQSSEADYQRLAELRAEKLRVTEKLRKVENDALNVSVTLDDLAQVLELWTGIPASKIRETELRKVSNLESTLKSKIIGQNEAVELVAAAVRRSRVQITSRRRPASFIFVGPTGVGKTELVKVLSKELFDTADPLIRLDMSEFMEKHAVSRIIGSPPGYVGYDEAGQLTEKVRRRPYSVVLFDEIEKAHPDVMNILLQILDEGKITDAQGRAVNFENTVIVMTSNAGSNMKSTSFGFNRAEESVAKEKVQKALSDFLRPEFLGRVDEVVVFRALDKQDYERIAALMLDELKGPLEEKGIDFRYTPESLKVIADKGFGKDSGARDLRRVIRKEVEDNIANMLLDNPETQPTVIDLSENNNELQLSASGILKVPKPSLTSK
ncbi:MAG: ATP-dependent Clp protease ATP-binding subunit [Oscillospiraceae bacterium]